MCKLCDLEFQKKVEKFLGRTDVYYRDFPEDVREYVNWCSKELHSEEGVYLSVRHNPDVIMLIAIADDPYCAGMLAVKYCPFCGRKLDTKVLE